MKVLIIEDEPFAQKELERLLTQVNKDIEVLQFIDSIEESVNWFMNNPSPELIFMDIQLSDGLSFEIFEKANVQCPVIFTTAFDEYAIKAFKVHSIDYLLKPIEEEELEKALIKFYTLKEARNKRDLKAGNLSQEQLQQVINLYKPTSYKSRFIAKVGDNIFHISVDEIPYFYFEEKVVFLVTKDNRRYIVDYTLEQLEKLLDPDKFFRINRKYITSIDSIDKVSKYFNSRLKIRLKPNIDDEILISRAKVKDFLGWLDR